MTIAHRNYHPRRFVRQDVLIRTYTHPEEVADPPVRAPRETHPRISSLRASAAGNA